MVCQGTVQNFFERPAEHQVCRAKEELGEDDGRMGRAEEVLREWFRCQEHLPQNYDKNTVRNFLRGSKHDLDRTKRKLQNHFNNKMVFPEFYADRDPDSNEFSRIMKVIKVVSLPKLTENGERVTIISISDSDVSHFDMEIIVKYILMMCDLLLTCKFPVAADILIFDLANLTPSHLVKLLGPEFKKITTLLSTSYPIRIKAIHLVNAPSWIGKLVTAVKPFCHYKVRERFVVHKTVESLADHVTREILPSELGGQQGGLDMLADKWRLLFRNNSQWFMEQEGVKSSGYVKSGKIERFQNHIGVEGSFRKLNID